MRCEGQNGKPIALSGVIVALGIVAAACSGADNTAAVTRLEDEIARLTDQLAGQSEEIAAIQTLTSELRTEIDALQASTLELVTQIASVRESVETTSLANSQEISGQLAALEVSIAEHAELLGWRGNYADGLWADMQAVLDCLDEILELRGVASIPNNSCRLIAAGMMGD